jgi:hypothetical protein
MRNTNAEIERDEQLRRALLDALNLAREHAPTASLSGPVLKRQAEAGRSFDDKFDNETHCLRLCRDLVAFGLAGEKVGTIRRGERLGLEHMTYTLTPLGVQLALEQIGPVKGVWDERVG